MSPANAADAPAPEAHDYPLLIKQLLLTPLAVRPEQEIVYGDSVRFDYRTLQTRIGKLAGLLTSLGVKHGDTVAVMDWDSNRYLESYFAVPMLGAVLMMVNIRLAPEQIAYTLNHSGARVICTSGQRRSARRSMVKGRYLVEGSFNMAISGRKVRNRRCAPAKANDSIKRRGNHAPKGAGESISASGDAGAGAHEAARRRGWRSR